VAGLSASRRDEPPQVASAQASACEDPEQQKMAAVVARGRTGSVRHEQIAPRDASQCLAVGGDGSALPLVHIRSAAAAGKLTVGFRDHWVPATNDVMRKQVAAWAEKAKVDVTIDFITSNGNKIEITQAAQVQARTGHDFLPFYN
jgi:hypothetical protein